MLIYVCARLTSGAGSTSEWERRRRTMAAAAVGLQIVRAGHTPVVPHLMFGCYYGEVDYADHSAKRVWTDVGTMLREIEEVES